MRNRRARPRLGRHAAGHPAPPDRRVWRRDADGDGLIPEDDWGTGLYGRADANRDTVITIEEEEWFEGWFDGDDTQAEIRDAGDVRE